MIVDREGSRIRIHDNVYPACLVICPVDRDPDEPEIKRTLGAQPAAPGDRNIYIPTENGLVFGVEPMEKDPGLLSLVIWPRTCEKSVMNDNDWAWLPYTVGIVNGDLTVMTRGHFNEGEWWWRNAEPEWVAFTINRLSGKRFVQPPGPEMKLVPLTYFDE